MTHIAAWLLTRALRRRLCRRHPTYARAGGPPNDWHLLDVVDLDSGLSVSMVMEVDCREGWLRRYTGREGRSGEPEVEILRGRFRLVRRTEG